MGLGDVDMAEREDLESDEKVWCLRNGGVKGEKRCIGHILDKS